MAGEELTFKEMCATFDVTPRTLRHYEYIELLAPRRDGRARLYSSRDIARMKLILRGRRFGFSLEELRQWLLMYEQVGTEQQMDVWIEAAERQLAALMVQRDELDATIRELHALHAHVTATRSWPRI